MAAVEKRQEAAAQPPKDNLVRATFPADCELRADADGDGRTLTGHFARFNEWTEINSVFEGRFLERIAPGAFKKTIGENRGGMRVLLNHGRDPELGDRPLGQISDLREDDQGAFYEAKLFAGIPELVMEGLRAGQYGASFRFKVVREDFNKQPERSDFNPHGLPERTITEAAVQEFGPVTFPAYDGATAGVRSLTDEFLTGRFAPGVTVQRDSEMESGVGSTVPDESTNEAPAPSHPEADAPRRDTQPEDRHTDDKREEVKHMGIDEMRERLKGVETSIGELASENQGRGVLEPDVQQRWDDLKDERDTLKQDIAALEERMAYIDGIRKDEARVERGHDTGVYVTKRDGRDKAPDDAFALNEYTDRATSQDHLMRLYTEGAHRAIDGFDYPHYKAKKSDVDEHLDRLVRADGQDKEIAQRLIIMGSPLYRSAFFKTLMKMPLSEAERQQMHAAQMLEARSLTTSATGGVTVPAQIDPTLIPTSNGALNPFRVAARNVTTTSYLWQGVTQGGVSFTYRAEGATMADNSPTLVARPIQPERADAFIPFSWEVGADWGSLESQLAEAIQDGKDAAEATKFAVGAGHSSNEPQGVLTGAGTVVGSAATTVIGTVDLFALVDALPPRYQANASWMASSNLYHRIRMLQSGVQNLWVDSLQSGDPDRLLGYPAYKASSVGTAVGSGTGALVASVKWGIVGDFSRFVIVDRVGLGVRLIDNIFAGNTAGGLSYPVGMSGIVAYYRNSSGVIDSNAFRVGTVT